MKTAEFNLIRILGSLFHAQQFEDAQKAVSRSLGLVDFLSYEAQKTAWQEIVVDYFIGLVMKQRRF